MLRSLKSAALTSTALLRSRLLQASAWQAPEPAVSGENREQGKRPEALIRLDKPEVAGSSPGTTPAFVDVRFPDGTKKTYLATTKGTRVRETLAIPPGASALRFKVSGQPIQEGLEGRTLYVQVQQLQVVDSSTLGTR